MGFIEPRSEVKRWLRPARASASAWSRAPQLAGRLLQLFSKTVKAELIDLRQRVQARPSKTEARCCSSLRHPASVTVQCTLSKGGCFQPPSNAASFGQ